MSAGSTQNKQSGEDFVPAGVLELARRIGQRKNADRITERMCALIEHCGNDRTQTIENVNLLRSEVFSLAQKAC